jgi:integrase/recombinase XerD|tara:strand:- start:346 stop:945 length:600 start_codon:yes stop_codon:yes gene_type:complete
MTVFHKVNRSGKAKVLSQDERDVIKSHLPEKYRLIAEILYWSAGRIGEVLSIRVRNLVPATGMVILERQTTKTKTTREVYLPPELMNALIRRANGLQLKGNDFLFFNQSPTQSTQFTRPLSSQSFDKELRRVCDWNGLSGISSHSFRRTQLTELYRDGWSLREIQHISGHRSLQSLQEYLDVDKEEVVDKFRQRMEVAA